MGSRERATSWRDHEPMPLMRPAGVVAALGASMMLLKGVLLIVTGNDPSLVPWFGLFSGIGLTLAAVALCRSVTRLRRLSIAAVCFGDVAIGASVVAVLHLVTGTIPETDGAPGAVGLSYVVLSIGVVVCLFLLGAVISTNHSLPGRWRWLPFGILLAQFPIFIIAGAIGDTIGLEDTADGLGLALTGVVWMVLGYSLTLASPSRGIEATGSL